MSEKILDRLYVVAGCTALAMAVFNPLFPLLLLIGAISIIALFMGDESLFSWTRRRPQPAYWVP